nr:MAG TPA: hypothetical protein [Bacteriophage sp.]
MGTVFPPSYINSIVGYHLIVPPSSKHSVIVGDQFSISLVSTLID